MIIYNIHRSELIAFIIFGLSRKIVSCYWNQYAYFYVCEVWITKIHYLVITPILVISVKRCNINRFCIAIEDNRESIRHICLSIICRGIVADKRVHVYIDILVKLIWLIFASSAYWLERYREYLPDFYRAIRYLIFEGSMQVTCNQLTFCKLFEISGRMSIAHDWSSLKTVVPCPLLMMAHGRNTAIINLNSILGRTRIIEYNLWIMHRIVCIVSASLSTHFLYVLYIYGWNNLDGAFKIFRVSHWGYDGRGRLTRNDRYLAVFPDLKAYTL